jgi:hypothetical protein
MKVTSQSTSKTLKLFLGVVAAAAVGVASVHAQWNYQDATEDADNFFADANTFNAADDSPETWASAVNVNDNNDGVWSHRFQSGPGNVAFNTNIYSGRSVDPEIYTVISGLTPDTDYTLRLYSVLSAGNNNWGLAYSANQGSSWSQSINRDLINASVPLGSGSWLENDPNNAVGVDMAAPSGDTRAWINIGLWTSDSSGNIRVDIRRQANGSERGVYDGLAYAVGVVPEPSTFALAGLGIAALLVFRRRRR